MHSQYAVSPWRWYVLLTFSLLNVFQAVTWNFYGPIEGPLRSVYGWNSDFISWLPNAASVSFMFAALPVAWLCDVRGLRLGIAKVCGISLVLCVCLRLVPSAAVSANVYATVSIASMVFNGISGAQCIAPPFLSAVWFPVQERTFATATMAVSNYLGSGLGFLTAELVPMNGSKEATADALYRIYIGCAVGACVLVACMLLYWPDHPKLPPSASTQQERLELLRGMRSLAFHWRFWLVATSMSIPQGVYQAWLVVLAPNLTKFGISQHLAGWLGVASVSAGCLSGIGVGYVADKVPGSLKSLSLLMYGAAMPCFALFLYLAEYVEDPSTPLLVFSVVLGGFFLNGTCGLFFELTMEETFTIGEGVTGAVLLLYQNLVQIVFLTIPIEEVGTLWMNWTLLASLPGACVALLFFTPRYARLEVDVPQTPARNINTGDYERIPTS